MATILDLRRQNARGKYPSGLDRDNLRKQSYGFIDMAIRNTPFLLSQSNQDLIKGSWGAPLVQIPVFSKNVGTATIGTMTCTFSDDNAIAQFANITFVHATSSFSVTPRLTAQSDIVTQDADFMRQFEDKEEELAIFLDQQIQLEIDNKKATAYNSQFVGLNSKFELNGDALTVLPADQRFFWNYATSILKSDNFNSSNIEMICSAEIEAVFNEYINQGQGNNQNSSFQFGPYSKTVSNSVPVSTGAFGTGYIMPRGSVAIVGRTPPGVQTIQSDLLGMQLHYAEEKVCVDGSTITGNSLDTKVDTIRYQMALSCAIVTPFDQSNNNGIKKFDFMP